MAYDLDQGGTIRLWEKTYLGPSLGWIMLQVSSIVNVVAGGTTSVPAGTTLVTVNFNGAVSLQLASSIPILGAVTQPLTVVDVGGFAATGNITILPFGTEKIMGLSSLVISTNFGGFNLLPVSGGGWNQQ